MSEGTSSRYTLEPEDAYRCLCERRTDTQIADNVQKFVGTVPTVLQEEPRLVLFRNVASLTNETGRLVTLAEEIGMRPLVLEYHADEFYAGNIDKHILLSPRFKLGTWESGRAKVRRVVLADVVQNQGKPFSSIKTRWSTPLVAFHHHLVASHFPVLQNSMHDLSTWLHRHGEHAREYYVYFLSLFVCHGILVETYEYNESEKEFAERVIYPAHRAVELMFGLPPLIVNLAPNSLEHDTEWWMADEVAYNRCLEAVSHNI